MLIQIFIWIGLCFLCLIRLRSLPHYKIEDVLLEGKITASENKFESAYYPYTLVITIPSFIAGVVGGFLLLDYGGFLQQSLYSGSNNCVVMSSVFLQHIFFPFFFILFALVLFFTSWIIPNKAWETVLISSYVNMSFLNRLRDAISDRTKKIRKSSAIRLLIPVTLNNQVSQTRYPAETKRYLHMSIAKLVDIKALSISVQRFWILICFLVIAIGGLLLILVTDDYVRYCPDHFYVNSFWELTEREYSYNDIKQGSLYTTVRDGSDGKICQLHLQIQLISGVAFFVFYQTFEAVSVDGVIKVLHYMKQQNVKVEVVDLTESHRKVFKERDPDYQKKANLIFQTAKELFETHVKAARN